MIQATLHQLKVFETAARHRSFTKAAEELYITQPTVSGQIKQLARSIGSPLFEQIGKQLYLTGVGQELFATCQEVFEKLNHFEMKAAALQGAKQGYLRLAVVTTAKYFIPRLLGSFCELYPAIEISLQVTNHETLAQRMVENKDDLYIMSQPPVELDLCSQPFLDNPLVVVARSDRPLARERNIPIQRLNNQPFIMRESGSWTRQTVQDLLAEHKISPQVRLELGSNEAIKQAIAGGLGISILSQHTLLPDYLMGELAVLDVQHFPIERRWYVSYLAGKQLSVIAEAFLRYLVEEGPKRSKFEGGLDATLFSKSLGIRPKVENATH
ncbi:MAG: LysR substrate-binding domain-containing protein [Cyanobacteriota bacterium]|nr:LysR substrate-binding domain-containing protein [Cyanobacteriota bacterium]